MKKNSEQQVVKLMIELYCKNNHRDEGKCGDGTLCSDCRELLDYAILRSEKCPFMENKTFCSNCTVHCYKPAMREKIRQVMRYSGPRMIFHHPLLAIGHLIEDKKEKGKINER